MTTLKKADLHPDPFEQFNSWYKAAESTGMALPNAMTLATADESGAPAARMVLLRQLDQQGFVFFTNYQSRKGVDLAVNPRASLVFYWPSLHRQIRIFGSVRRISDEESDAYFQGRPRGSQLGAWASPQSQVIPHRATLLDSLRDHATHFGADDIPRPPFWGGFRVTPETIEFWQEQPDRLHDRLRYRRLPGGRWFLERLAP